MKIVIFNPLRDTRVRGISRYASELGRNLRSRGHEVVELAFPASWARLPRALEMAAFVLWQQLLLPVQAARRRARLVIEPYNSYSLAGAALFETLCVYHDFIAVEGGRWLTKPFALYQRLLHLAARLLPRLRVGCVSAPVQRQARRWVPGKEPLLLPNVVTPLGEDDRPCPLGGAIADELARNAAEGRLTVCTISGEGPNKDFGSLVAALGTLGRPVYLVAFGFRGTHPPARAAAGDVLVRRAGPVAGRTIARAIRESDVFVFHSLAEGYGRPVAEALLEGKVVVTSPVPALETLSEEARRNVIVCAALADLGACIEAARARPFRPFARLETHSVDEAIGEALRA